MRHHQRVALMALCLGRAAGLGEEALSDLFRAAIVHDAGAVTYREKAALEKFDVDEPWEHCRRGHAFLADVRILGPVAEIVFSHHDHWAGGNPSGLRGDGIPLASRIIHLADRVDVLIREGLHILDRRKEIVTRVRGLAGQVFDPYLVELLGDLAQAESFWLDLTSPWVAERLLAQVPSGAVPVEIDDLSDVARVFARVVDAKSPFTYRHSRGVALVARFLGERMGLPPDECALLKVAGLLHDLGKLIVPEEILDQPGALTEAEFDIIKQHPYYTYWLLRPVAPGLPLAAWAAYHHERLDGTGYPFRIKGSELDRGARITAVADKFTALREARPYRPGLTWSEIERIISRDVAGGALDGDVVSVLFTSRHELDDLWAELSRARDWECLV